MSWAHARLAPSRRRLISAVVMLLGMTASARAWACPACAADAKDGQFGLFFVYAAMVTLPFLVAYAAVRVIRKLDSRRNDNATASGLGFDPGLGAEGALPHDGASWVSSHAAATRRSGAEGEEGAL